MNDTKEIRRIVKKSEAKTPHKKRLQRRRRITKLARIQQERYEKVKMEAHSNKLTISKMFDQLLDYALSTYSKNAVSAEKIETV